MIHESAYVVSNKRTTPLSGSGLHDSGPHGLSLGRPLHPNK